MFSTAVLLLFSTLSIRSTESKSSPVLMWGVDIASKPALPVVRQQDFQNIITSLLEQYTIVAFLEANLTTRDFLCRKQKTHSSCFAHLSQVNPMSYFVKVEEPMGALLSINDTDRFFYTIDATKQQELVLSCQSPGILYIINFNDSIADRSQLLELHDSTIASITKKLICPVVNLYMSSSKATSDSTSLAFSEPDPLSMSEQNRLRRAPTAVDPKLLFSTHFVIYFTKIVLKQDQTEKEIQITALVAESISAIEEKITLQSGDGDITFDLNIIKGYAVVKYFRYNNVPYRATDVETPIKFSYYCGQLWTKANESNSFLIFSHLQFQFLTMDYHVDFKFGTPWHCVGYFTPAILSGLFVLLITLAIMGCGVCWIMDIHTNDRFEDPQGVKFQARAYD